MSIRAGVVVTLILMQLAGDFAGARGHLHAKELDASHAVSRAVFAVQRAQVREAEAVGLRELAAEIEDLKAALAPRRASGAPLRPRDGSLARPIAASVGAAGTGRAVPSAEMSDEERALVIRHHRSVLRQRANDLQEKSKRLRSVHQQQVASSALRGLAKLDRDLSDLLQQEGKQRVEGARAVHRRLVRRREERLAADDPLPPSGLRDVQPTMTTIVRHRHPVRRLP